MNGELSPDQQQILRQQEISESGPGTILRDFETLLDFIATHEVQLGGKQRLLPLALLGALNARLSKPLEIRFDHDHLYQFTYRDRFGAAVEVSHPYTEEPPMTDEVKVGQLPLQPGDTLKFLFDFGDNWRFNLELERIDPPDPKIKRPRILDQHGRAPQQYPRWDDDGDEDGEDED
jgi:hypothetical protein